MKSVVQSQMREWSVMQKKDRELSLAILSREFDESGKRTDPRKIVERAHSMRGLAARVSVKELGL